MKYCTARYSATWTRPFQVVFLEMFIHLLIEKLPLLDLRFGVRLRVLRGKGDLEDLLFDGGLLDRLKRVENGDLRLNERDLDLL